MIRHWGRDNMVAVLADVISKVNSLNENCYVLTQFSMKFVPLGSTDNKSSLVQIRVWRRTGFKPLSKQWWTNLPTRTASLGLSEFWTKNFQQPYGVVCLFHIVVCSCWTRLNGLLACIKVDVCEGKNAQIVTLCMSCVFSQLVQIMDCRLHGAKPLP